MSESKARVLVIEDELAHAEALVESLELEGYELRMAGDGESGLVAFERFLPHVVVTDLKLPGEVDGLAVIRHISQADHLCEVILITAHSSVDTCKQALFNGAYDYIEKPIDLDRLRAAVRRAVAKVQLSEEVKQLHDRLDETFGFEGVIGESPAMLRMLDMLRRAASSDIPVLIQGESGVGKELIANAIHQNSPRRKDPFVAVNCAGISETLLESELFGHMKGAFTGATSDRKGFFAAADGGTLFLDEIGDMPIAMQAKLLRVLENQMITPVGSTGSFKVDVRIISATNQDIERRIEEKQFRQDLYFRIRGVNIQVPPLRERRSDIPLLLDHFVREFAQSEGRSVKGFTPAAQRILTHYAWPGNVRELRNCVKTMVVLAETEWVDVADLPFEMHQGQVEEEPAQALAGVNLTELEKEAIQKTLDMVQGNREQAAKLLGIGERTLYRKIKEYGLSTESAT